MPHPRNKRSLDGVASTGPGAVERTEGHYHYTLVAAVDGTLDTSNDTLDVALEGSPDDPDGDGGRWVELASVSASDFSQDPDSNEYTAHKVVSGAYFEGLRCRLKNYTDAANGDLGTVDAWALAAGRDAQGARGIPEHRRT